ncbi:MAG: TIGR02611 family protein [Jatrophihabitantaceae bacterium]
MAENPAGSTRQDDCAAPADDSGPQPPKWLRPVRDKVTRVPGGALIWRLLIGTLGLLIVLIGVALIPLPGPGWVIVFVGVAVWATEFSWAQRLLQYGRSVLHKWTEWVKRRSLVTRVLIGLGGLLVLAGAVAFALITVF